MSVHQFYRLAVWLPLIVPALVLPPVWLLGMPQWQFLGMVIGTIYASAWTGGIPYLLLALWASIRIRSLPESRTRKLAVLMPLYMVPLFCLYVLVLSLARGEGLDEAFWFGLIGTAYLIPIGYAYVGLTFGLRALAGRIGWLTEDPAPAA